MKSIRTLLLFFSVTAFTASFREVPGNKGQWMRSLGIKPLAKRKTASGSDMGEFRVWSRRNKDLNWTTYGDNSSPFMARPIS